MDVTFLGTGSAMPTGTRMQTGLLLSAGDDRLLVDCGSGALHSLAATETGYEGVDTLLLTHHHLDHISDIPVLMKARWLAGEESLTIAGPSGTEALIRGLLDVHEYMQDRLDLTFREVSADESLQIAGFDVEAMETIHSMDCLAYRVTADDGPAFVFSGDSEAFEELIDFADGAAVLAHDCSFPDDVDVSNHPTPSQLGETLAAADSEIDQVYLTHLYPHTEGRHEEMLESIASSYDGDVQFASDGLTVPIE